MHDHDHSSGNDHSSRDSHSHGSTPGSNNERRVFWALILTASFMVAEVVGGVISGSLALIADAGHMLTDAAALALAWGAFRISRKPADRHRTYGYDRFQVLAAFTNGLVLLALVGWIIFEAVQRILEPQPIMATPMLVVAVLGLFVNIAAFAIMHGGDRENINIQGALVHIMGDLLGSVATIIAAIVIWRTGWTPIDPILSLLVALLILRSGWLIVRRAAHILMEGTPDAFDAKALGADLVTNVSGLLDIHHVHVWLLTTERPLVTMHATVADHSDNDRILALIKTRLTEEHGLGHSTVQIESEGCADH